MGKILKLIVLVLIACSVGLAQSTYYVAPTGNDAAPGTIDQPFLTVKKAASIVVGGDTILVRGGVYNISATVSLSARSGADSTKHCCLFAYPGEHPIFDFSAQASSDGLKVNGNFWYLKGLECANAPHNGIAVNGSHNMIENCAVHDNKNTGMQFGNGASFNRIINCDSYYNYDAPLGGNADGFAPKLDVGTGNYFYGCRSWQNSDDGWDGYLRPADSVITTLENCLSFMNGYLKDGSPIATGNGNGFKMGGGDNSNGDSLRHFMTLKNCLSFDNRVKGFDQNNNRGSMTVLNCTAYRNGSYNFSISGIRRVTSTVTVINCIALGTSGTTFLRPDVLLTNSWMSPFSVSTGDFVTLDTTGVRGPRNADGSLPDIAFMHLVNGSQFVDAGTNVGLSYSGSAPDLGAFETQGATDVVRANSNVPRFELEQNYPNPFNPVTVIRYQMPATGSVSLKVFDLLGREVATLVEGIKSVGLHSIEFDGSHCASGTYLYRLTAGRFHSTGKMQILK